VNISLKTLTAEAQRTQRGTQRISNQDPAYPRRAEDISKQDEEIVG